MKFLIVGAGAIGVYLGASLAHAGQRVAFLARPATAAALRAHGLSLRTAGADEAVSVPAPEVYTTAAEARAAGADVLLLTLKAYDTAPVLADLQTAGTVPPPILCLENGVGVEAEIAQVFGADRVIAGTVTTAVSRRGLGAVVVERPRGLGLALGHPLSAPLLAAFTSAGLQARGYASAPALKWSKLLTNLLGNATSACLDWPVDEIFARPALARLEMAMVREALAVMRAVGAAVVDLPGVPVRTLALGVRLPAALAQPLLRRAVGAGRGGKMPSFHIDVHSGRGRTEAPWLNGAVAAHGRAAGVAVPVNQTLAALVEDLAAGRRKPADFRHQPERLLRLINEARVL